MKLEQVKKWAVSQLTALIGTSQSQTVLEVNDFKNRGSDSKLFEVGPIGVGVLAHPFLGCAYNMQEYNRW